MSISFRSQISKDFNNRMTLSTRPWQPQSSLIISQYFQHLESWKTTIKTRCSEIQWKKIKLNFICRRSNHHFTEFELLKLMNILRRLRKTIWSWTLTKLAELGHVYLATTSSSTGNDSQQRFRFHFVVSSSNTWFGRNVGRRVAYTAYPAIFISFLRITDHNGFGVDGFLSLSTIQKYWN